MSEKEIFEKVENIRKNRIIDIYLEEEFMGEGIVVDKKGKTCIYTWKLGLSIETNNVKQLYFLEEFNIDPNKIEIMEINIKNNNPKCINVIDYNNLKVENNDDNLYNNLKKQIISLRK